MHRIATETFCNVARDFQVWYIRIHKNQIYVTLSLNFAHCFGRSILYVLLQDALLARAGTHVQAELSSNPDEIGEDEKGTKRNKEQDSFID